MLRWRLASKLHNVLLQIADTFRVRSLGADIASQTQPLHVFNAFETSGTILEHRKILTYTLVQAFQPSTGSGCGRFGWIINHSTITVTVTFLH